MAGTSWPALVDGQRFKASGVEAKFDWLEGSLVPMQGGSLTDGAYALGNSSARWSVLYAQRVFASTVRFPGPILAPIKADTTTTLFRVCAEDGTNVGGIRIYADGFSAYGSGSALSLRITNDGTIQLPKVAITAIDEFSSDGTFSGNSDLALPTEKATKAYAAGLLSQAESTSVLTDTTNMATATQLASLVINASTGSHDFIVRCSALVSHVATTSDSGEMSLVVQTSTTSQYVVSRDFAFDTPTSAHVQYINLHGSVRITLPGGNHSLALFLKLPAYSFDYGVKAYSFYARRIPPS